MAFHKNWYIQALKYLDTSYGLSSFLLLVQCLLCSCYLVFNWTSDVFICVLNISIKQSPKLLEASWYYSNTGKRVN